MDRDPEPRIPAIETIAGLYLVVPLLIFFASYIRAELAIPACALITYQIYDLVRRTCFAGLHAFGGLQLYFLMVSVLWIVLAGGIGPLHQNDDWEKHYSVINYLIQHRGLTGEQVGNAKLGTLHYYIGWYLVPAWALKLTGAHAQILVLALWSVLGIFLFFCLLPALVGSRTARIWAPVVFMFFSGADLIGLQLNHKPIPNNYHLEWWAQWIQYSSTTTSIFWVPQHAIPAWIGAALLMRARQPSEFRPFLGLVLAAILLWSPFSAVGTLPFLFVCLVRSGWRKIALNWRTITSFLLLALPVASYLLSGSDAIPSGFVVNVRCPVGCFTWHSYLVFLAVEVAIPLLILWVRGKNEMGFLTAATVTLALIPLYTIGDANDFAMRTSLPALAIVAILCGKALFEGRKWLSAGVVLALLIGLPTPLGEIARGFQKKSDIDPGTTFSASTLLLEQYFSSKRVWVLR